MNNLKIQNKFLTGPVIWLTGLPCSGKTTIAIELEKRMSANNYPIQRLDGDIVRTTISKDLGFSKQDRDLNIERIAYVSELLSRHGIHVIVSFVSPYQKMRDFARNICPRFIEVHVKCPIEECIRRDVKGMYQQALEGKINDFTGVQDPYEEPLNPDMVLYTDKETLDESVSRMMQFLDNHLSKY